MAAAVSAAGAAAWGDGAAAAVCTGSAAFGAGVGSAGGDGGSTRSRLTAGFGAALTTGIGTTKAGMAAIEAGGAGGTDGADGTGEGVRAPAAAVDAVVDDGGGDGAAVALGDDDAMGAECCHG